MDCFARNDAEVAKPSKELSLPSDHVVILGGSSGIGLATARRLRTASYKVTIAGRDPQRLAAAKQSLGDVAATELDAADPARVRAFFANAGAIDHLVLAFGSRCGVGPFASVSLDDVRKGFEEKVFPQFACAQSALPTLRQDGSLIFLSAISGQGAAPGTAGIGAANAAVATLTPILAAELKPLRVNCVSPGVIDTPWWDFLPAEQRAGAFASFAARTPAGRVGQADDVAKAIAFLIEDDYMSGQTIICDGGLLRAG
jgi:NAD(P)-dependent dehydrogenase (short-subunit alcohol dehydrogenase family)